MKLLDEVGHLPLWLLGLRDAPAVPYIFRGLIDSARRLFARAKETQPARDGLTNRYTIDGSTATALEFLYGVEEQPVGRSGIRPAGPLTSVRLLDSIHSRVSGDTRTLPQARAARSSLQALSLQAPTQFSMSWTTFAHVYEESEHLLDRYAATLTDVDAATDAFWPTIAENGAAYIIDLSIFTCLPTAVVKGFPRFTPATVTLLVQDATSRALRPVAVRVAGRNDAGARHFAEGRATPSAWLYALQAAKVSVTVYGIWLGHVYHWHIVTAAMQMAMFNTLRPDHPVRRLIEPQSNYLIQFDELLLVLWRQIAPPTSVTGAFGFFRLMNTFAAGRVYFDDDPTTTLERNGITESDFTRDSPWDAYPTASRLLGLWRETERYVDAFVENTYANDALVREDRQVEAWMIEAGDPDGANIGGMPKVRTRADLARVLTSLVYRITAHGYSRLKPSAYPAQAFIANFPPCLQIDAIPSPDADLSTEDLLQYLPKTGTIGEMMTFYNTFIFSTPYAPFVPVGGADSDLFWPGGPDDPRNRALIEFRKAVIAAMKAYEPSGPQIQQWPMNIET